MHHRLYGYSTAFVSGKVSGIWCNFHAMFQKFCIISIGTGVISITTLEVKFKCC